MLGAVTRRLSKLHVTFLLATAGCAGSGGGSGTETGNPLVKGNVSYSGYSSEPDRYGVRKAGSVAKVDRAWLDLGPAALSRSGGCELGSGQDLALPALGLGDHAAGAHNFTTYEAEAAEYCSFSLPFELADEIGTAPDTVSGHSLLLEGTLADGTPFSIASDEAPQIVLEAPTRAFSLDESQPDVLVAFDFGAWLANVDFDSAERTASGIVIDESNNTELLQQLQLNLAAGIALYRDRDGDGALDARPELLARAR